MLRRGARARAGLRILRVLCLLRPLRLRDPGMKAVIETLPFFRSVLDLKCDELCMQVDVSPQHTVLHTLHPGGLHTHRFQTPQRWYAASQQHAT